MKIGAIPENFIEQGALKTGHVPVPSIEVQASLILAKSVMTGTRLGIFEALKNTAKTLEEIATICQLNPLALEKLLLALVNSGYLIFSGEKYQLSSTSEKWLLRDREVSLYDFICSRILTWEWLNHLDEYIRTGKAICTHELMSYEQRSLYHAGMRSFASLTVSDVISKTPIPPKARHMLDVGGGHDIYSVALCKKHPGLHATIFDLPESIEFIKNINNENAVADRIDYDFGNILTVDLGTNRFDIIFVSNLIHHFDVPTNLKLFKKFALALRSGGYLIIQKAVIPSKEDGQLGSFIDLFFSLTSAAGNWSFDEISDWQKQAGLVPRKTINFTKAPSSGQQVAMKP